MTVPISDRLSQLYVGNGANTRFDFTFRVFNQESESGVVVRQKTQEGFTTIDPSNYTVTLNSESDGGHIDFLIPPASNIFFYIAGATPLDQLLDITNYDNFYPEAIERALDKLTVLLQEWGIKLDQEKQERILADIKYDSLAMEREENLENRLTSYINAVVGVTNPKIFEGISDRMIITQDGRTQREFNASIPFWTDDYVSFKQETYLREEQILDHVDQKITVTESTLITAVSAETSRAELAEAVLDGKINANGVGNRSYKTWAEMDADKLNIPPKSKVTITNDPNPALDGDWNWDGAVFTKSNYDPLPQSKKYTDEKVSTFLVKTPSKILHAYSDSNGDVYSYYDGKGHLRLTELPESVQTEIINLKQKADTVLMKSADDLYHFVDLNGNLAAKFDKSSKLFLAGLDKSVQDYLLNINTSTKKLSTPKTYKTKADLYTPEVMAALQSNAIKAPIGRGLLQQQYYLGKEWLKNLSALVSSNRIVIGAYNDKGDKSNWVADSGVVHPNVIQFDEPVCGFKYWMGINPYTNTKEDYELPYIYGSNSDNLDNWTLIPDFPQPFDVDPPDTGGVLSGHLSDSFFTYDPVNAELWFCWRQTRYYSADRNRANATNTFVGRKTKDGTNWSDIIIIYPTYTINSDLKLSPAILYNSNDGLFYLYYINLNGSMSYEVTEDLSHPHWRKVGDIQLPFTAWHLEMKWLGGSLVALIHSDTIDQLFVGVSNDMKNWDWSAGVLNAATNLYKSSFIPVFNDNNQISLKIVYTTDQNSAPNWQLHTTQTNFTSIEA